MERSSVLKYGVIVVLITVFLSTWYFGILGSLAQPIAEKSSSSESCEIVYRDSCGRSPIAINEKFSFLYGQYSNGLCNSNIKPRDRIEKTAELKDNRCTVERSLDKKCTEELLNTVDSDNIENIRLDNSRIGELSNLGACWEAYQELYR